VSSKTSSAYAPAVFAKHPNAEGITKQAFAYTMERLLAAGHIHVERIGPNSRRTARIAIGPSDATSDALQTPFRRLQTGCSHTPPIPPVASEGAATSEDAAPTLAEFGQSVTASFPRGSRQ
jgi:hypothetical protein